jgi:hypothetical protein
VKSVLNLALLGALTQRAHELALSADEQPPTDDDAVDQRPDQELRAVGIVTRVDGREERRHDDRQRDEARQRAAGRTDRGVEQGHHARSAGQAGDGAGRDGEYHELGGSRGRSPSGCSSRWRSPS